MCCWRRRWRGSGLTGEGGKREMTNASCEVSLGFVTWVMTSTAAWTLEIEDEMKWNEELNVSY